MLTRCLTPLGGSGAEAASFLGLANSMDGSDIALLDPLVCEEFTKSMLRALELDDDGSTCIG